MAEISSLVQFCLGALAATAFLRILIALVCRAELSMASGRSCADVGVSTRVAPLRTKGRQTVAAVIHGAENTAVGRLPVDRNDAMLLLTIEDRILPEQ